ncbi:hypothetical protein BH10PLA1_BH10PLA1_18230 [soil metagenome]
MKKHRQTSSFPTPRARRDGSSTQHNKIRIGVQIGAFTLVEVLVVIGVITIILGIVLAGLMRARASANNVRCLNNLRQITTSFRMYTDEWNYKFPDPGALNVSWESTLSQLLPDKTVFICPADSEIGPATGSSYDWRDTGNPLTTVAGQSINSIHRDLILTMEALPGWHKARKVNVGRLDGSVESIGDQELVNDLMCPVHPQ